MTWWTWVLLVVVSLVVLGLLGLRLFTQVRALLRELRAASRRVADTQAGARESFQAWRAERLENDEAYLASLDQDVR